MKTIKFVYLIPPLLAAVVSVNFFWSKPLVPGFDTPHYLTEIRGFISGFPNPLAYPYLNRYLTIALPALLGKIFHIDPVNSYRLAVSLIYIGISLVTYKLFYNLTKNKYSALALCTSLVISPFLISYSTMLLANFTAFLFLFLFFAVETGSRFRSRPLVLGVIYGLVFYIHNFSAASFGIIITAYYLLEYLFTGNLLVIRDGLKVLIVSILVGFFSIARYLGFDLFNSSFGEISTGIGLNLPAQLATIGREKELIISSFVDHAGKYWLLFCLVFISFSLLLYYRQIRQNISKFILPLAIFVPSFIFSLQPVYHLSYLPERFASLVSLSIIFFYAILINLPMFKNKYKFLIMLPLVLTYLSSDSLILNKGYRSFSNSEIRIYESVRPMIPIGSVVFVPSEHFYWSRYFLRGVDIVPGEHFVSCGDITDPSYFDHDNYVFARLLAEPDLDKAQKLSDELASLYPDRNLFILADHGLGCAHGRILTDLSNIKAVYERENWSLYEFK